MYNTKDTEIKVDEEQVQKDAERVAREKAVENANKKIVIVDTQEMAEAEARKAADAYMTEDKAKSGIFKKFWKHTFLESFYRQRQVDRVREEILNSGNMYTGRVGDDKTAHNNTMQAVSERFISDYDGLVREGEKKEVLNDKDPKTVQAKNDIKNIITLYAQNNIQEEAFNEEKNRIFNRLNNKDTRDSLNSYADNLLEIAQNARIAIEHGAKMDEMDLDTNIILGKAKSSLKTEAHYNFVDKAVAWTKKSKIGRFFSPALISTTIGLGYSLTVGLGTKVLRSKVAAYGTFGAAVAVSTALAGMNESQRLAAERAQHGLERAEGGIIEPDSKRREEMEQFQYQMESSKNLAERLRASMFEKDKDGNDVPRDIKQSDLDKIFASLAEIDARKSLNEQKSIDLISYTNIGAVEKESMELDILTARAKIELKNRIQSGKVSLRQGETFDSYLTRQSQAVERCLLDGEKGIDANDKNFGKFRTKKVIKKMLITAAVGLTVGAVAQEAWAFNQDNNQGLIEGIFHHDAGATTQTPLENIRGWITGHPSHLGLGNPVESILDNHNFKLPEGTSILQNSDKTFNIFRGDQLVSDHIPLTFDNVGNIDEESIARLGEDGIVAHTTCTEIDSTKEVITHAKDWVHANLDKMTHISRSWMGNDTPMYPDPDHPGHLLGADLNELRTQWAGINGTGFDEDGDVVMSVQHMTNDGSFQDGVSVAARDDMMQGKLEVLLSVTKDTQTHVIKGLIGTDGLIHFSHEDANTQMLFENVNGHAKYDGAFIEIAKHNGNLPDGREAMQILSTHIGTDNVKDIIEKIPGCVEIPITNLDLPIDTEPPMFIPFFARTPLEKLKEQEKVEEATPEFVYYMSNYGGKTLEDELTMFKRMRSETLEKDPTVKLDHYKEIEAYLKKQNPEYVARIEKLSNQTDKMEKNCKVAVCIPVAGHQEGDSIYESLQNYTYQTAKPEEFELTLLVNHPEKDKEQINLLNADKTLQEIERFKKDYPNINVRVMYEVLSNEEVNIGKIRKLLVDSTLIREQERGADASDLIIISNDADNKGVSPKYIQSFIDKFESNPKVDGFLGQLDWDPESYQKYPAIHVGTRLFQFLNAKGRFNTGSMVSSGANSAFRSSIYAGIGGYAENTAGEDISIRKAIMAARGENSYFGFAGVGTRLFTSSRRSIDAWKSGVPPVIQWSKGEGFSIWDDVIRKSNMERDGDINYEDKEIQINLKKELEAVINLTLDTYEAGEKLGKDNQYYKTALKILGIRYSLDTKGNIVISNMDTCIRNLKKYQIEGKLIRDSKSGKSEATQQLKDLRDKEEKEKEKPIIENKKEVKLTNSEEMEKAIENFIDELPNNKEKIDSLNKLLVKSLNNELLKKIGLNITINEIKNNLEKCKKIESGAEFINKVKEIIRPISIAMDNNPVEFANFKRKAFNESHNFKPLNEVFSYRIDGDDLHLHMAPATDLSTIGKIKLIKDAIEKLPEIIKSNKKVKKISATSWIVASNPRILERIGFKNEGPISDETRKIDFEGETEPISRATMSREEFLTRYSKGSEGFMKKFIRFFGWGSKK